MRWVSASAGAVATASALLVLASAAQPHAGTPAAVGSDTETTTPTQSVTTAPAVDPIDSVDPVGSTDLVDSIDLTVAGLDSDVSSVLANEGYTDLMQPSDLGGQLDPVVAKALADANTVLVIPDGGGQ